MDPSNSILQFLNTIPIPMVVLANLKIIVAGITTFLALLNHGFDSVMDPIPLFSPSTNYDFIIVGGGSAGAVVANRLSTNPNFKVLLLEAGGNPTVLNSIPAMAMSNMRNPYTDWMTRSEPLNTSCLACKDNLITISRGKMLGGSSSLNVMVYMRGNPNDFDNWANLTGDASWSYENVLPYFKKSEDYTGNYPDPKYHGTGGPLSVTAQPDDPLTRDWMSAAREMGFSNSDPNAEFVKQAFVPIDHTMKDGRRWSTYNAFIQPVLHRRNFKVIRYAHVTKVNFDSTKRAVGVSYIKNGRTFTATASKEVVLSAGGIGSPHVLMLSGIGHSDHLKSFGRFEYRICRSVHSESFRYREIVHKLCNVRGGSWAPMISCLCYTCQTGEGGSRKLRIYGWLLKSELQLTKNINYFAHKGPLASNAMTAIGLFSTDQPPEPNWPNLYAILHPIGIHKSFGEDFDYFFGFKEGTMKSYCNPYHWC
ncbi:Oxygen-dependent choline dehydrogenase [Folsomia candida]|uniref:Oxygen-dependent choline dehydrogenase n=1 Tax=Folsomia candida TaxID=158441 RepID=A0A226EZY9_FOLCA|nr:Oxygen-dependent choline dehydrogenase [Folsomia candida]